MGFALRLFHDDFPQDTDWSRCRLRQIFDGWYIPNVLRNPLSKKPPAADATLTVYRNALDWWESTSGDPPAGEINKQALENFVTGLAAATYRRGAQSRERKLSTASQAKHVQQIVSILGRLHADASRPSLGILSEPSPLERRDVEHSPKPTPDFETFRDFVGALERSGPLKLCSHGAVQPVLFWRALLATLYCHGWRVSTALGLRWEWLEPGRVTRIRVPPEGNRKTKKGALRPVPAWLLAHWKRQRITFREGEFPTPTEGPIFDDKLPLKTLARSWARIQKLAYPGAKPFALQSLRRLHAAELGRTGFDMASGIAQAGLQHSSRHITNAHYADFLETAILRLPEV
jgi:integrase